MSSTASLIRNPDSGYFAKTLSKERSAAIVLSGNGNDSDDEEVSTPSKTPKAPKSMARVSAVTKKLEAENGARGANNDDFDDE
ncbi:hypothetical protein D6C78_11041 [Aureobasidium pullulans]|uniref:Uncharacterized protein n=1 Tax=Aureobasidium pullulans TaxID=5580 RepID=A0A4T0B3Z2_AURPU|nr:hypothetical protein D6C78_11041 [Aureobasidium pullulans]